jgi:hypothetical protein
LKKGGIGGIRELWGIYKRQYEELYLANYENTTKKQKKKIPFIILSFYIII